MPLIVQLFVFPLGYKKNNPIAIQSAGKAISNLSMKIAKVAKFPAQASCPVFRRSNWPDYPYRTTNHRRDNLELAWRVALPQTSNELDFVECPVCVRPPKIGA